MSKRSQLAKEKIVSAIDFQHTAEVLTSLKLKSNSKLKVLNEYVLATQKCRGFDADGDEVDVGLGRIQSRA